MASRREKLTRSSDLLFVENLSALVYGDEYWKLLVLPNLEPSMLGRLGFRELTYLGALGEKVENIFGSSFCSWVTFSRY